MWVLDFVGINWSKLWRSLSADRRLTEQGKDPYCTNSHTSITFALSQNKHLDMGTSVQKHTKEKN